ncbi:MAG: hypothetical protein IT285_09735 [Bdellovibrionales bacterium]|nr:hypothetical protein [Bdellovibrionales bacterium]
MWLTASGISSRELVGGKGLHLQKLVSWGAAVPTFGVVTTEAFRAWRASGRLPEGLVGAILGTLSGWGAESFAVRSSATSEDGSQSSYAGIFDTFLHVDPDQVADRVVDCFRSATSERAREYEARRGSGPALEVAVVIQAMVSPLSSGVAFSRAPTGNSARVYVEAGWGLGEGVVSGKVEIDAFWWDRFGAEIQRKIGKKTLRMERQTAGLVLGAVPHELAQRPCLEEPVLKTLVTEVASLELRLGAPADVEWAWDGAKLWILQVRPITQRFPPLAVYVDTNLAESYPGRTSPLTQEFVSGMYTRVFEEAARWLGFSGARITELRPHFQSLLQGFEGHLYYHLNSYYSVMAALPGGERNLASWHRMIGGALHGIVEYERFAPHGLVERLRMTWAMLKLALFPGRYFGGFSRRARRRADALDKNLASVRTAREAARLLVESMKDAEGWGLPAVNDVFVMSGLKAMEDMLARNGHAASEIPRLLRTREGVESLKPLRELTEIGKRWGADARWGAAIRDCPSLEELARRGLPDAADELRGFLARYGDRAFEELKLECLTFRQDPAGFLRLCAWMAEAPAPRKESVTQGAQARLRFRLLDRLRLLWIRPRTECAIQIREETRLLRGRYFGWVRSCVVRMAELLALGAPREYFGLTLADFRRFAADGDVATLSERLKAVAAWDSGRRLYPEMLCHPRGQEQSVKAYFAETESSAHAPASGTLQGVGAAAGRVRGAALAIEDPRDALRSHELEDQILVTRSTDPAWIFIMSRCKGLISEKGSLLSHTAIVGRELGIPTVVGVPGAYSRIPTGTALEMDGQEGWVKVLEGVPR